MRGQGLKWHASNNRLPAMLSNLSHDPAPLNAPLVDLDGS